MLQKSKSVVDEDSDIEMSGEKEAPKVGKKGKAVSRRLPSVDSR